MHHVPYEWVRAHVNASRHIWMSHGTHGWVKQSGVLFRSLCVSYQHEWVMAHIHEARAMWMSHGTHAWVKQSGALLKSLCVSYHYVALHLYAARVNESWHTYMSVAKRCCIQESMSYCMTPCKTHVVLFKSLGVSVWHPVLYPSKHSRVCVVLYDTL